MIRVAITSRPRHAAAPSGSVSPLWLFVALCAFLPVPAHGGDTLSLANDRVPSPETLLAAVASAQTAVKTLSGVLEREVKTWDDSVTRFSGRFYWRSPCYRMHFSAPEPLRVVYDGRRLMTERPAAREFTVKEMDATSSDQSDGSPWFQITGEIRDAYRFKVVGKGPAANRTGLIPGT